MLRAGRLLLTALYLSFPSGISAASEEEDSQRRDTARMTIRCVIDGANVLMDRGEPFEFALQGAGAKCVDLGSIEDQYFVDGYKEAGFSRPLTVEARRNHLDQMRASAIMAARAWFESCLRAVKKRGRDDVNLRTCKEALEGLANE